MNNKYTQFYAEMEKDKTPFTLFVDTKTAVVYRANNTSLSKSSNFIAIAFVLILLRLANGIPLSYDFPIYILFLTVFSIVLGIGIGISFYKSIQGELRSIDITKETMEEYIEKGRRMFKNELLITVIFMICSVLCIFLFLIYLSLIWLLASLFFNLLFGGFMCNLSFARYQVLFKNKLNL